MKLFNCGICKESLPDLHRHVHHKIPRANGGSDDPSNLIELCPGCHDALHSIAYKLMSKKTGQGRIVESLRLIYKDKEDAQRMCLRLAVNVRDAMIKTREEGLSEDHLVQVSTSLRKKIKSFMEIRCKEQSISQEAYIRSLIVVDLHKRFPAYVQDPVGENRAVKAARKNRADF